MISNEPEIEVFLTSFNEARNLEAIIKECLTTLKCLGLTFQIYIIDNASEDETESIFRDKDIANVSYVRFIHNVDYSLSIFRSATMCRAKFCIIIDGDGQFSPHEIPLFLDELSLGQDLVLGNRKHLLGGLRRRIGSRFFLFTVRLVLGFDGPDINAGIRGLSRAMRENLIGAQKGRLGNPNLWYQAKRANLRISYVMVEPRERGHGISSLPWNKPVRLLFESLRELYAIRTKQFVERR